MASRLQIGSYLKRLGVIALLAAPVAVFLLLTPLVARWGTDQEVARWSSPGPIYGAKRPLWLSIHQEIAYVDILSQYPTYYLYITDGGYGYLRDIDIPGTDPKSFISGYRVTWKTDGVQLLSPEGDTLFIPSRLILRQIGPD